jgi:hypothetical protein
MTSIYCETCGEWVFGARPDDDAIVILIHAMAGHALREMEISAMHESSLRPGAALL